MDALEYAMRDEFNRTALRRLAVLRPLKVVITNYPEGKTEELDAVNNPENPAAGTRKVPFSREVYIERADFMETTPPKYFRLKPGGEVRLKYAYIIKCDEVIKDSSGEVVELRCTADLESKSGGATSNRKIKGTIHWVSAQHAVEAEVRLYDRLFTVPEPDAEGELQIIHQPTLARDRDREMRAVVGRSEAGIALSVRTSGLFCARSRFTAGQARFQSHHHPARHLGEEK